MTISLHHCLRVIQFRMYFIHFICNALIWSLTIMHEPAPSMVTSHSILSEISQLKKQIVAWPRMSICHDFRKIFCLLTSFVSA